MTVMETVTTLIDSWHLDETPGPWTPEPTPEDAEGEDQERLWLTNAVGDNLVVDAEDAAVMVNAVPLLMDRLAFGARKERYVGRIEAFDAVLAYLREINGNGVDEPNDPALDAVWVKVSDLRKRNRAALAVDAAR